MPMTLIDAAATTLPAATATTLFSRRFTDFGRLDIALTNTGANAVTAATFEVGVGSRLVNDATRAAAIVAALSAGGTYSLVMTAESVPHSLRITLTSASGTTVETSLLGTP